jgi:hypothetical protein
MNASIQGALDQLNKSWRSFEHKGKRMTKQEVKSGLEYGKQKGYGSIFQLSDSEVDNIICKIKT